MVPGSTLMYGSNFCRRTAQAAMLEQHADGGAGQPFAQRTDHAAGHENMLGHAVFLDWAIKKPRGMPVVILVGA